MLEKALLQKGLQDSVSCTLLHVSMDAFIGMMPERLINDVNGLEFCEDVLDGHPIVSVHSGAVMRKVMIGMHCAVAALVGAGYDLVVDDVMFGADDAGPYRKLAGNADVFFVGLDAPLDVIEHRERLRGDRRIGLARGQYTIVHSGMTYDLRLDTSVLSAKECTGQILTSLKHCFPGWR